MRNKGEEDKEISKSPSHHWRSEERPGEDREKAAFS